MTKGPVTQIIVHYLRYDRHYTGWSLWLWLEDSEGIACPFTDQDEDGMIATASLELPERYKDDAPATIGMIVRYDDGTNPWADREFGDRYITLEEQEGGIEVWILQGRAELFTRRLSARWMDFHLIRVDRGVPLPREEHLSWSLQHEDGRQLALTSIEALDTDDHGFASAFHCLLQDDLELDAAYTILHRNREERTIVRHDRLFETPSFHQLYTYTGTDLGATYTSHETRFRLWAPTAAQVELVIYESGQPHSPYHVYPMNKAEQGTWVATLLGDGDERIYTYRVLVLGEWREAVDPYARAVTVGGERGVVLDPTRSHPEGWATSEHPRPKQPYATDAIIYELHVRDLSVHPASGVQHKGLFLGLTEQDTASPAGLSTGLTYVKELGVTHIQLLPIFDYQTVDERNPAASYNWGYDPKNYNAPEGSYATNPYDPACRIRELKAAILAMHREGLGVIMDVVYNHMYKVETSWLELLVPGYYYRTVADGRLADGTGVGNDTASERPMMRKLILDSVTYWAREYQLDGFRFDLMGIHDLETMRQVRSLLDEIDPSLILIGEGWDLATPLQSEQRAVQAQAAELARIGHFNDAMRDGLRGSVFEPSEPGFLAGNFARTRQVQAAIAGGIPYSEGLALFAAEPEHCVNYAEAHDNHTLWDKLALCAPHADEPTRIRMQRMAAAIVLSAQGIAFLHAGQEFLRTKQGEENSYRSPDEINWLDWTRRDDHEATVQYVRGWVRLRREHPALRLPRADLIRRHLRFLDAPAGMIAYTLEDHAGGDPWRTLLILHHAHPKEQLISLPARGPWHVVCDGERSGTSVLYTVHDEQISVSPLTSMVLYR